VLHSPAPFGLTIAEILSPHPYGEQPGRIRALILAHLISSNGARLILLASGVVFGERTLAG
jgi:hypothetical protein